MKIIYAAYIRFPSERAHVIHIAKTCEAFARAGYAVTLVVPAARAVSGIDSVLFYGLKDRFAVMPLYSPSIFPTTRLGYALSSLLYGISLFFHLLRRRREYDIVYSMELEPFGFLGIPFSKKPYFFEIHAPRRATLKNRFLFRRIGGVVTVNEGIWGALIASFPALKERIIVCPNGTDITHADRISKEEARKSVGMPAHAQALVYTGSFQNWKGVETILEAAETLNDISFYLVGGRAEELRGASIPKNVAIIPPQQFSEMPYWRAAADVLLVTGTKKDEYSYRYTSPMKLFEYLSAKRPIVAAQTPAIESVVSEREVLFFEPDNARSLADKIRYVFSNHLDVREYAERAYERAKEYSWDTRTKKILQFIRSRL